MPRVKKPASQRLSETINTPVPKALKRRVLEVARIRGVRSFTSLAREYIEAGVSRDEAAKPVATN